MGLRQRGDFFKHPREPLRDRTQRTVNQITDANTKTFPCAVEIFQVSIKIIGLNRPGNPGD
ncbi:hypothetical protein OkiPb00357_43590 [Escherichia coli]